VKDVYKFNSFVVDLLICSFDSFIFYLNSFIVFFFFLGEIGIYMTIYDAKAENPKSYGSERFYFMELTDKLYDHLAASDIVHIRESLEKKCVFQGAYIERFSRGKAS